MNLFYQPRLLEGALFLEAEEARHCLQVLRKKTGELIHITDGKGTIAEAVLTAINKRQCQFSLKDTITQPKRPFQISIGIAPTKNQERIEWAVEKMVETGVENIYFIQTKNSERTKINFSRIQKKALEAMKQSFQYYLPEIHDIQKLETFLETPFDAEQKFAGLQDAPLLLKDQAKKEKKQLILIGPEGDFTEDEKALLILKGFMPASLGPNRLRTETAALLSCHTLNLINL